MAHIDEVFDYIKRQQDDLDALNRYIRCRLNKAVFPQPSNKALLETGIDMGSSRATIALAIIEQYFKKEEDAKV
jgi:hypothetical protein